MQERSTHAREIGQPTLAHIAAIRAFNRFYTTRLGLLRKHHLNGDFSLTEARTLYEIGTSPGLTARTLRNTLELDAGYISRTLAALQKRRLIRQTTSKQDAREKHLSLTVTGEKAVAKLNHQSEVQIHEILAAIPATERSELAAALTSAQQILSHSSENKINILRLTEPTPEALALIHEYYEAVHVVQRDTPEKLAKILHAPNSGMWLAYLDNKAVGCVLLRDLPAIPNAGECKRLYVQPTARGHHIAARLMDALEDHARSLSLTAIYLDSYHSLEAAITLYRNRGYEECPRYNDNPQATIFLRKQIQ